MSRRSWPRRIAGGLGLSLVAVVAGYLFIELFLWVTGMDQRMVRRGLYFNFTEVEICEHDRDDPVTLYRLRANSRIVGPDNGNTVHINEHRVRGPAYPLEKAPGVFRVMFLGASTLYGAGVNDDETMAATLELALENRRREAGPDYPVEAFEVWNWGTSAYRMSQMARVGRLELERTDPDLILLLYTNRGRRAFLGGNVELNSYWSFFRADPYLLEENFAAPPDLDRQSHRRLMFMSPVYRYWRSHLRRYGDDTESAFAEAFSRREATLLRDEAAARGVPVLFVSWPGEDFTDPPRAALFPEGTPDEDFLDLGEEGREPEFYEVHPPPYVLREWGETLASMVVERERVPAGLPLRLAQQPPEMAHRWPRDGATVVPGWTVDWELSGDRSPPDALELVVRSDLAGELWRGRGPTESDLFQFTVPELPAGTHAISLSATDGDGAVSVRSTCIVIEEG